jgi:hypothetical protein
VYSRRVDVEVRLIALALLITHSLAACSDDDNIEMPAPPTAGASGTGTGASSATSTAGNAALASASGLAAGSGAAGRTGMDAGIAGAAGATTGPSAGAPSDDAGEPTPKPGAAGSGGGPSFTDSFEQDATLDPARYEIVMKDCSGTGTAAVDTSAAHSGTNSLRIQGGGGYCNHVFVRPKSLTNALPAPLYARVFVKVATALTENHVTFIAMHDLHEDKDLRLGGQKQVLVWNRESDDATLPELSPTGVMLSAALPPGDWHCLEWSVNPTTRAIETWLDERAIAGLTVDAQPTPDVDTQWLRKTDWQPQPIDVRLGWESYGNDTNTLWLDDLALGTTRLRCAP